MMALQLSPELEELVASKVKSGRYRSRTEVIEVALRLLDQRDDREARRAEFRAKVEEGIADADAGRLSQPTLEELTREARARYAR